MTKPLGFLTEAIMDVIGKESAAIAGAVDVLHDTAFVQQMEDTNTNNNCRFYYCYIKFSYTS